MYPLVIEQLDLEPIMVKIMEHEEGLGWSLEKAMAISEEYKKYLLLCLENPNKPLVPSKDVDDFWHFHILDSLKYHEDCQNIFGKYLHHFPYFGMRGEDDAKNLSSAWQESCSIYKDRFGEMDKNIWQASARCPNCGRRATDSQEDYMKLERPRLPRAA